MKPIKQRESAIENYLVRECFRRGWDCIKMYRKGMPDRLIVADLGLCAFVECKRTEGVLSALQARTISKLAKKHHLVLVVYSKEEVNGIMQYLEEKLVARVNQLNQRSDAIKALHDKANKRKEGIGEIQAKAIPGTGD